MAKTKEIVKFLGQMPDNQIAKKFGISRQWVKVLRERRRIPKYRRECSDEDAEELLTIEDLDEPTYKLSQKYNISGYRINRIKRRHGKLRVKEDELRIIEKLHNLNYRELTDKQIAEILGVSWRKIQHLRLKYGLLK